MEKLYKKKFIYQDESENLNEFTDEDQEIQKARENLEKIRTLNEYVIFSKNKRQI
jgi:hypothetical protein